MAYVFSPSQLAFYDQSWKDAYDLSGTWPSDAVDVSDETRAKFYGVAPVGFTLGADITGQPMWVALPPAPAPTNAQQAAAMLATGIAIVSTGNSSLNGTYPCDARSNSDDGNLLSAITAGLTLPGGVAVRIDISGNPHAFPPADFKNYCQAKLIFQQQLNTIIGTNAGEFPVQPTVIP